MADFSVHYVVIPSKVFVKGTGHVTQNHIDWSGLYRRLRPQPFNVQGVEDPRPIEGQIWPRGLQNQNG